MNNAEVFAVLAYLGMLIFGCYLIATIIYQMELEGKVFKLEKKLYNLDKNWKLKGKI